MRFKKVIALTLVFTLTAGMAACGSDKDTSAGDTKGTKESVDNTEISYADIVLGETYKDLKASIKVFNHRTDMSESDYAGTNWEAYIKAFNEMYPNITVEVETDTNYADDALLRLQGGDWGDIMMIPAVDKGELSTYFMSYGSLSDMEGEINYADTWMYDNEVYGVPSTATAQGIVYNKAVFEKAGIKDIPKTPDEFIEALKLIKENTDAIPLYTNYADGWTMGAWDAYIAGSATGSSTYMNQELLHAKDPFADQKDGTHAYAVYKILYDAVANGCTEDDYSTTVWEDCKGMINNGEIGCMVLGSWAYSQMVAAGEHGDDIGYMSFPITVDGKQYASAGADYSYGINVDAPEENKEASLVFVKWMTEKSGFSFNEGGLPIQAGNSEYPDAYTSFSENKVEFVTDEPAVSGEEDLLNSLNADSELNINNGGNDKIQAIVEHAANGDKEFDEIMQEWNDAWTSAQESNGVEIK